jgi:hypothetical protein
MGKGRGDRPLAHGAVTGSRLSKDRLQSHFGDGFIFLRR